jgi:hypothetical protein
MVKLDEDRIRWIIKCKDEGKKNEDIANVQKISVRRVQQIYSWYRKNKMVPTLRKPGRHVKLITVQEREIVRQVHKRFHANAAYLERYLKINSKSHFQDIFLKECYFPEYIFQIYIFIIKKMHLRQ